MTSTRAKILVIYTGGTIGMGPDASGSLAPLAPQLIRGYLPQIDDVDVTFESFPEDQLLDSSAMEPSDWVKIGQEIAKAYHKYDGFVVLHGTDTLAYSASALSFMFKNLGKPVVLTASMMPLGEARSDGVLNYLNSVLVAAQKFPGMPKLPEVVIVFGNKVLRGNRARKISGKRLNAFESYNCPPLGVIEADAVFNKDVILPAPDETMLFEFCPKLNDNVLDIVVTPGIGGSRLSHVMSNPENMGYILRTFGSGNTPAYPEFIAPIKKAFDDGKIILNVTQSLDGRVRMGAYATSGPLKAAGVVSGHDMTPEAALVKLMHVLANFDQSEWANAMETPLRGELSRSSG